MTFDPAMPASRASVRRRRSIALLAGAAMAVTLGGCKHDENFGKVAGWTLVDPAQRHPIIVSQQPEMISLNVPRGSSGLTPRQRAELLGFADSARASDAGNSRLVIAVPSGTPNEVAAVNAVHEIRGLLSDRGFSETAVSVESYSQEGGRADAPIKVSFLRFVAEAPQCGTWPANLASEPQNLPYANFGCANQRNLAAMVANPADLLGPRSETARPAERRLVTWEKYIKGETTGAEKSEDEKISTQEGSN